MSSWIVDGEMIVWFFAKFDWTIGRGATTSGTFFWSISSAHPIAGRVIFPLQRVHIAFVRQVQVAASIFYKTKRVFCYPFACKMMRKFIY